ncbi:NADH:flavin oxidoreductase/NADH oxidase family protein [Altererythrobacter sp. ZODW24]|uniref:NADH:flavin oxidoreductase/NADH oxidase family protein n=1 Tax=Altererythrobacter sp. ZODW24 TaxID=2185142 RepID=UPI000DF81742|nr:NADH:flavin oxidoreductase/NADH oxidase family protein [Altererythrobacter sp. ZODW24]
MTNSLLFTPLELPNGAVVPNRICKAAMEENLAEEGQLPGQALFALYERWAKGGSGMILTGNVMVAPDALTGPGGVVLQKQTPIDRFARWAEVGKSGGGQMWMQINHPGRQVYKAMGEQAVSPSDVPVDLGKFSNMMGQPRALTEPEIEAIITRFADTAQQAERAGFDGVQIHAAHGYLVSQFLSPLVNQRTDKWGGSLENRARFLLSIVDAVRARVGPAFGVGVKLNSADFQKGGFSFEDARQVVEWLNDKALDCVELSGGSYESPAMQGTTSEDSPEQTSTEKREAYFVKFARDIAHVAKMPIMVTGGITRLDVAKDALEKDAAGFGVAMLGIARALAFDPDLPHNWEAGENTEVVWPEITWKSGALKGLATMSVTKAQLERISQGKDVKPNVSPLGALLADQFRTARRTKRYKKWRAKAA